MTDKVTVTEALAEIVLIGKKMEKHRSFIQGHISMYDYEDDPFEKEGGTKEMNSRVIQAITDLGQRLVRIRSLVAESNLRTVLTIGKTTLSLADWLVWRREIAESLQQVFMGATKQANNAISINREKPRLVPKQAEDQEQQIAKLILNVDIPSLDKSAMEIEEILGVLDGKLSLLNATTIIEI